MKKLSIFYSLTIAVLTTSCEKWGKKNEPENCTDGYASNYDKKDGACRYQDGTFALTCDTAGVSLPSEFTLDGQKYQTDPYRSPNFSTLKKPGRYNFYATNGFCSWSFAIDILSGQTSNTQLTKSNATFPQGLGRLVISNNGESGTRLMTFTVVGPTAAGPNTFTRVLTLNDQPTIEGSSSQQVIDLQNNGYNIFGESQNNHKWQYFVDIKEGKTITIYNRKKNITNIPFGYCNVSFHSNSYYNISVYSNMFANNPGNYIGSISRAYNPADPCLDNYVCSAIVPIGTYTYQASTIKGSPKSWSGTVNANVSAGCVKVPLN